MKKFVMTLIASALFFFTSTKVSASTILIQNQVDNGFVTVSLKVDERYVGALDLELTINGNVNFDGITYDSSILSNYTKKYSYNASTKTIRVNIATGDVKKNLVDQNGIIKIGTIKISSDKSAYYNFKISKLTVVDTKYTSIVKSDLQNESTSSFEYQVNNQHPEEPKPEDPKPENPKPETPKDPKPENPAPSTPQQPSENQNNSNPTKPTTNNGNQDNSKEEKPSDNEQNNENEQKPSDDKVETEQPKQKKENNIVLYIAGGFAIVLLGLGIYFFIKKK